MSALPDLPAAGPLPSRPVLPLPGPGGQVLKADALIVTATLLASCGWIFSLKTLEGLPPQLFVGIRFLLAGLVVAVIGQRELRAASRGDLIRATWPGLMLAVAMITWIEGLRHAGNLGVGAFICSLGNILAPLAGRLIHGWRLPRVTLAAAAIALLGLALLFLDGGGRPSLSDSMFLASALASALGFIANARLAADGAIFPLTAVQLAMAGLGALLLSAATESWPAALPAPSILGWLAASVLIATSLRFFLQVKGQGAAPVSHTALLMCLEPVWMTFVSALWFGTPMSHGQMAGSLLIFAALLLNGRRQREALPATSHSGLNQRSAGPS